MKEFDLLSQSISLALPRAESSEETPSLEHLKEGERLQPISVSVKKCADSPVTAPSPRKSNAPLLRLLTPRSRSGSHCSQRGRSKSVTRVTVDVEVQTDASEPLVLVEGSSSPRIYRVSKLFVILFVFV